MKKFLRKLVITFGILMLFLAIDIAVAWYFNPQAQTPVQAVRLEATHVAAQIAAKALKSQIKKEELAAAAAPAPDPAPMPQQPGQAAPPPQAQPQQQSGKDTHLDDIQADGNILVYTISVKANGQAFDMLMSTLRTNLFPSGCTKPEYERLLEYGMGVTLDFRSMDGLKQSDITFTPETCGYEPIVPSQQQPPKTQQ
jgi:hypothetical protein